jgi:hypothetical protein
MSRVAQKTTLFCSRLAAIVLLCGLSACAPSSSTGFLSLLKASNLNISNLKSVNKVKDAEGAYLIDTTHGEVFGSSLKECGVPPKATPASLNRQLFVGFDNLKISRQERFKTGQFTSEASAKFGEIDIFLLAISTRTKNCIIDVVFWKQNPDEFEPETIEVCKKIAAHILALQEVR